MITETDSPRIYAVRLVKDGPRVALKVWYGVPADPLTGEPLDRAARWHALLSGVLVDPDSIIMRVGNVAYVKGDEITEADYDYILSVSKWASSPGVDAPEREPRRAIDLNKLPPVF